MQGQLHTAVAVLGLCCVDTKLVVPRRYTRVQNVWSGSKSVVTFGLIKILTHPFINNVAIERGERSKIGQNCLRIVLKSCQHEEGG